jgi:hypothetical protein
MGACYVMRPWLIVLSSVVGVLGVLDALAETPRRTIDVSRALDAGSLPSAAIDFAITPTPPDPPPLVERAEWVFDLRWDRGQVWLLGVHGVQLTSPQSTPRAMGRFALQLFEGPALLERVRFDFPLLGAAELDAAATFAAKLRTRIGVVFPATKRGTRLELWDRATNRRWPLPWPPSAPATSFDGGDAAPGS